MFGVNGGEMIVLVRLALCRIGPERPPERVEKLVKSAERYATGATEDLEETLGPDLADVDWRRLDPRQDDPRTIAGQALLEDDDEQAQSAAPRSRPEPVRARLAPGERAAFDAGSTRIRLQRQRVSSSSSFAA